jgi:hypothetical protein
MRIVKVIGGLLICLVATVVCLVGAALCCTIVLAPFGIMMFGGAAMFGALGVNMVMGRPVWVRHSKVARYARD